MHEYTLSRLRDWWRACTPLERTLLSINYAFYKKGIPLVLEENREMATTQEEAYALVFKEKFGLYDGILPDFEELVQLTSLNLARWGTATRLTSLKFLEPFRALRELNIRHNQLEDLSGIEHLPQLKTLNAAGNKIQKLEFLTNCQNLEWLDISNNNIYNLRPLAACKKITDLFCSRNEISSLEGLRQLPQLRRLTCSNNYIEDLEPIQGLNLKYLDYRHNPIVPLFIPVVYAPMLMQLSNKAEILAFWWQQLPIYYKNLLTINYEFAQANKTIPDAYPYNIFSQYKLHFKRDFDPVKCDKVEVSQLVKLKQLNFNMQEISDTVQSPSRLAQLETLEFLAPFLAELDVLIINFNKIDMLLVLHFAPKLRILKCECNPLKTLSGLMRCFNLEELYIGDTGTTNLMLLSGCKKLRLVSCGDNPLDAQETQLAIANLPDCDFIW